MSQLPLQLLTGELRSELHWHLREKLLEEALPETTKITEYTSELPVALVLSLIVSEGPALFNASYAPEVLLALVADVPKGPGDVEPGLSAGLARDEEPVRLALLLVERVHRLDVFVVLRMMMVRALLTFCSSLTLDASLIFLTNPFWFIMFASFLERRLVGLLLASLKNMSDLEASTAFARSVICLSLS